MGILQAWILEWVALPSSKGSSQPRDQTQVSGIAGRFFTDWAAREAHLMHSCLLSILYFTNFSAESNTYFFKVFGIIRFTFDKYQHEGENLILQGLEHRE